MKIEMLNFLKKICCKWCTEPDGSVSSEGTQEKTTISSLEQSPDSRLISEIEKLKEVWVDFKKEDKGFFERENEALKGYMKELVEEIEETETNKKDLMTTMGDLFGQIKLFAILKGCYANNHLSQEIYKKNLTRTKEELKKKIGEESTEKLCEKIEVLFKLKESDDIIFIFETLLKFIKSTSEDRSKLIKRLEELNIEIEEFRKISKVSTEVELEEFLGDITTKVVNIVNINNTLGDVSIGDTSLTSISFRRWGNNIANTGAVISDGNY